MRWNHMPLMHLNSSDEFRQGLALSYDVSEDGRTYTMYLDPDAIWHDGTPVTADQLKASWEFGSWPENQPSWGGLINYIQGIEGMRAVGDGDVKEATGLVALDDHTLEITLASADYIWPINMTMMMLGFVKVSEADTDPDWWKHPTGIGPFTASFNPDTGEPGMVATDNYWREPAALDRVELPVVPDVQTRYIMYENGEIDMSDVPSEAFYPEHRFNNEIRATRGGGLYYMALKTERQPFDDINVRKAIAHGVDMKTIIESVFEPTGVWATGIISPSLPCFEEAANPGYVYDPELARASLAQSTYGSGANLPPMTVAVKSTQFIQVAELMQEQLRDNLGLELNIMRTERGQEIPDTVNMRRRSKGQKQPDVDEVVSFMTYSKNFSAKESGFVDPVIDAFIEAGKGSALDDPARCTNFVNAEQKFLDGYYAIPLGAVVSGGQWLMQPWVLGFDFYFYGDWINLPFMKIATRTGPR
jgi:oligopeptide transport system substrate-binding protein